MRPLILAALALVGSLYGVAAYRSFEEETAARGAATPSREPHRHPEANLRVLREAFATGDYSDGLTPRLERALEEAPSFYQPAFLLATFHANRIDEPERTRAGFEAALERFPSNGRLHLTFAEWLLTPRPTAPYRANRVDASPERRAETLALALDHVERAAALEPELTRQALNLMLRARLPAAEWSRRLPRNEATRRLLLEATDRAPRDRETREALLREFLAEPESVTLDHSLEQYAGKWGFPELALDAAEHWRRAALDAGTARDIRLATVAVVTRRLEGGDVDGAYELLRETLRVMEERHLADTETVELLAAAGDVYLTARRNALAQGLFTEAVTLSPYHVRSRLGLARVYREAGDVEGARAELGRVLDLEPANQQARTLLELLER
jgi:Tfp pilus assembly protein PilF